MVTVLMFRAIRVHAARLNILVRSIRALTRCHSRGGLVIDMAFPK